MTLLADERQRIIVEHAEKNGGVRIIKLAEEFDVSVETVRRDINRLTEQSKLRKVHGGAVPVKTKFEHEPSYNVRIEKNMRQKRAIGEYAAGLIGSGQIVMLDCGITVQCLASAINGLEEMTFITNSIPTAAVLLDKLSSGAFSGKIFFIGGRLEPDNRFSIGPFALQSINDFNADVAFISTTSVAATGFYMYNTEEGAFSAKLLANSNMSYVLAESQKFSHLSAYRFAELSDADAVITDSGITSEENEHTYAHFREAAANSGLELIITP